MLWFNSIIDIVFFRCYDTMCYVNLRHGVLLYVMIGYVIYVLSCYVMLRYVLVCSVTLRYDRLLMVCDVMVLFVILCYALLLSSAMVRFAVL